MESFLKTENTKYNRRLGRGLLAEDRGPESTESVCDHVTSY